MKTILPDPALVHLPASAEIRRKWIGRFVRIGARHMNEPDDCDPRAEVYRENQIGYRERGVGEVLDVGTVSRFMIRWSNGLVEEHAKKDLDVYAEHATALSFGPRLFPRDFGGGDVRA